MEPPPPPPFHMLGGLLDAPDGPSTPFATPALILLDSIRVVIILVSIAYAVTVPTIAYRSDGAIGQTLRHLGSSLLALGAAITELEHMGDYANIRIALFFAAAVFMGWGLYAMFKYEEPPRTHDPDARRRPFPV
jgi:hypothetical protein